MPPRHVHAGVLKLVFLLLGCGLMDGAGVEPFRPRRADPLHERWRHSIIPELSGQGAQCMTEGRDRTFHTGRPTS